MSQQAGVVKVGIAGLGRSGWNIHAKHIEALSDKFQVVAVTDPDTGRMKEAADKFGCKTYPDFEALLGDKDVELQVVATPSYLHAPCTIQALKAGKDVVCEKPMATSLAEADEMIATSKETGKLLSIFQNRRYAADFVKVKEVLDSGKLGRIVMIRIAVHGFGRRWDWQTLKEYGGGSLNNTGPHFLDEALQLMGGDEVPEVFCQLECTLTCGDADDHAKVILRLPGHPMIDMEITAACPYGQPTWLVMGTQGGLTGNASGLKWKYFDPKDLPPRQVDRKPTPDRSYNREDIPWQPEESWDPKQEPGPPSNQFYVDLYETIRNGKPLHITPESVRRQMAVLEECHRQCPLE
ncbi:MAG: Gfo/Idh/MocA family oxidoreductase [Planctomycetes bacterium]|nr:Gfo/Idh/MocA family oxidoreductase [Planctomycetota bacterium]